MIYFLFCSWLFLLMKIVYFCDYISVICFGYNWSCLRLVNLKILKLFLLPLLSTFKLYNTQPNLQQKSAMVWQGFMLQVRLQRFFCKSERKFNFCPPFLCKNVKNWNCICKWDFFKSQTQFDFLAAIVLLLFCCWDFLLIERWPVKDYIQIFLKIGYFQNEFMKSSFLPKY